MKTIKVRLRNNPYNIYIDNNILVKLPTYLKKMNLGNYAIIVTSAKVNSLYKNKIKKSFKNIAHSIVPVANGEAAKSKKWLFSVIDAIIASDTWGRKVFVIALGGGTVGDLSGFGASIYKRGVPYVQIPTTLLAQVDSSIGGKTAIDLKQAKNILGTFHQPKAVFIDPTFLKTLSKKEINEGLAETIKYGIIKNKTFFNFLQKNSQKINRLEPSIILKLISTCAAIKAAIVKEDETETKGIRTILNFGHTLAHALETTSKYNKLSHGEAVSIGMSYSAKLSLALGKCKREEANNVESVLKLFSLPTTISGSYITLSDALRYDKKFINGKVRMVLMREVGEVEVVKNIPLNVIRKSLKSFLK
ncbi:MAG: 3-dehydroquinate synthase [Candidatus Omnitrophica bacterium]|nr:3-dehydroquinate synthase [Candidatus Omnitrophota bacterium]